jgi:hypothetical protein
VRSLSWTTSTAHEFIMNDVTSKNLKEMVNNQKRQWAPDFLFRSCSQRKSNLLYTITSCLECIGSTNIQVHILLHINMSHKRSPPSGFSPPPTAKIARSDTAPTAAAATSNPSPASAVISTSHSDLDIPYPSLDPTQSPAPPQFGQPVPLITFSYDSSHTQHFNDSALRVLAPTPPIGADLNYARDRWTRKPDTRGRLDGLLKALVIAKDDARKAGGELKVGVCTWRGVMTKSGSFPFLHSF